MFRPTRRPIFERGLAFFGLRAFGQGAAAVIGRRRSRNAGRSSLGLSSALSAATTLLSTVVASATFVTRADLHLGIVAVITIVAFKVAIVVAGFSSKPYIKLIPTLV